MTVVSASGFLALITYVATLVPSNLTAVFPQAKKLNIVRWLFKQRKTIGLMTFFWAAIHSAITISLRQIDFLSLDTYHTYYTGLSCFSIFTLLALTSNKFSVRKLKKGWKKLHNLTYLAMILLIIHICSLMEDQWTRLTSISLCLLSLMAIFYLIRLGNKVNMKASKHAHRNYSNQS